MTKPGSGTASQRVCVEWDRVMRKEYEDFCKREQAISFIKWTRLLAAKNGNGFKLNEVRTYPERYPLI